MRRSVLVAALALGLLLALPFAYADFPDNFDGYLNGTTSPGVWSLSYSAGGSSCFTGTGVTSLASGATPAPESAPNVYAFDAGTTSACYAAAYTAELSASFNVTSATVVLSFYYALASSPGAGAATLAASLCGTQVLSTDAHAVPGTMTQETYTVTTTVGSTCQASIELETQVTTPPSSGTNVYVDSLVVKGANAIQPGANFILYDSTTGQWFNESDYAGSYVQVNFPAGSSQTFRTAAFDGINLPDMALSTTGASSIAAQIGSYYSSQMLVPVSGCTSASPCKLYVAPPGTPVAAYTFPITDLSGNFPAGSDYYITQGTRLFDSGTTDSAGMTASLVPGTYTIEIVSGANSFETAVNLPDLTGYAAAIQILSAKVSGTCGQMCSVGYNAAFDAAGTSIVFVFNDSNTQTTSVSDSLYKDNATGLYELYTHSFTGTYGGVQDSISCATDACNSTLAPQLHLTVSWSGPGGSGSASVPLAGTSLSSSIPAIPSCLLGWCVTFPRVQPIAFAGLGAILMAASVFSAYSSKFGSIVVAILSAALAAMGWGGGLGPGASGLMVVLAIANFIAFLESGK